MDPSDADVANSRLLERVNALYIEAIKNVAEKQPELARSGLTLHALHFDPELCSQQISAGTSAGMIGRVEVSFSNQMVPRSHKDDRGRRYWKQEIRIILRTSMGSGEPLERY